MGPLKNKLQMCRQVPDSTTVRSSCQVFGPDFAPFQTPTLLWNILLLSIIFIILECTGAAPHRVGRTPLECYLAPAPPPSRGEGKGAEGVDGGDTVARRTEPRHHSVGRRDAPVRTARGHPQRAAAPPLAEPAP